MDYLITTTLPNLKEVNTLVTGVSEDGMKEVYLKILNSYSVFSIHYHPIWYFEKNLLIDTCENPKQFNISNLYEILKPYERKETDSRTFSNPSSARKTEEAPSGE